jgi:hypothetical protein
MDRELRTVQVKRDSEWVQVRLCDISEGDTIRMFEPDGEPVLYKSEQELYAQTLPYLNEETGRWEIRVCTLKEQKEWEASNDNSKLRKME